MPLSHSIESIIPEWLANYEGRFDMVDVLCVCQLWKGSVSKSPIILTSEYPAWVIKFPSIQVRENNHTWMSRSFSGIGLNEFSISNTCLAFYRVTTLQLACHKTSSTQFNQIVLFWKKLPPCSLFYSIPSSPLLKNVQNLPSMYFLFLAYWSDGLFRLYWHDITHDFIYNAET